MCSNRGSKWSTRTPADRRVRSGGDHGLGVHHYRISQYRQLQSGADDTRLAHHDG